MHPSFPKEKSYRHNKKWIESKAIEAMKYIKDNLINITKNNKHIQ